MDIRSAMRKPVLIRAGIAGAIVVVLGLGAGAIALGLRANATTRSPAAWQSAEPSGGAGPDEALSSGPAAASASASPSHPAVAAAGKAAHGGTGARLRQVDGGTGFYGKFRSPLPTNPSFFPISVWQEGVQDKGDTDKDLDAGINTYLAPTDNSNLSLISAAGMYAISSSPHQDAPATAGWFLADEADMWGGPGGDTWSGNYPGQGDVCSPASAKCGYSVEQAAIKQFPGDGRLRYSNYGKGVTFWESTKEAGRFVNDFQDVISVDNYWLTDQNICGASEGGGYFGNRQLSADECHRPSNYGRTVDHVRSLVSPAGSKPVWNFVEVGHPGSDNESLTVKPPQVAAAVWSSIIHGARGIVYFNHSFAGPCVSSHALRESCYTEVRGVVKRVDSQIKALAPVLNAPSADSVVKGSGGVDVSTKWYDGNFYILAGANQSGAQTATFSMPCVGDAKVTVLNENRVLTATKGSFSDAFADANAVHIYRVDGGSSCGAY
jgi:hypothetical protein